LASLVIDEEEGETKATAASLLLISNSHQHHAADDNPANGKRRLGCIFLQNIFTKYLFFTLPFVHAVAIIKV
jgi:hypothetical protein